MGRPLNKKYFGNRNVGSGVAADRGLGGNQIDGITLNAGYLSSYSTRPTITFPAPDYAALGAVTATAVMISEVLSATISGGTGYGNAQTFELTVANAAGETAVLLVTSGSGGNITTVNSITTRGTFTALTAVTSVSGGTGTGAIPVLAYRAKAVTMTNKGSGYTTPLITSSTAITSVSVGMTNATSGTVVFGSSTTVGNNENSIITFAYLPTTAPTGLISGAGGSSTVIGDIVKQRGKITYTVETAQGIGKVKLVSTSTLVAGQMYIQATDSVGGTYYVSKLFARTAVLTPGTGSQFPTTGTRVLWTFGTPVVNKSVKIANG